MKTIYFFLILIGSVCFTNQLTAQVIFEDDFDSYDLGPIGNQNPTLWRTWSGSSGGTEDLIIDNGVFLSGTQAGFIGGSGAQDVILQFGNLTSGVYTFQFQMYIPFDSVGYMNVQGTIPAGGVTGVFQSGNINFGFSDASDPTGSATPGQGVDEAGDDFFVYPEGEWFPVQIIFDVDNQTYQMYVNGTLVHGVPQVFQDGTDTVLGGIDFFSIGSTNQYWLEDVVFSQGVNLDTPNFDDTLITMFPNPVKDVLNLNSNTKISRVELYNLLGQRVFMADGFDASTTIDLSTLPNGTYLIKMTAGEKSFSRKLIK